MTNATMRRLMRGFFEPAETSWVVSAEAVDGREGIRRISDLKPDVAVLDLAMPVMIGLEAARVLTKNMPEVPLILFSLHVDSILERKASTLASASSSLRPKNMQILVSKIRAILGS